MLSLEHHKGLHGLQSLLFLFYGAPFLLNLLLQLF